MKYGGLEPKEFDSNAVMTIPEYDRIHENVVDIVAHSGVKPGTWLDTGCGTGKLVSICIDRYDHTDFIMADPMEGMLEIAMKRAGPRPRYICSPTDKLDLCDESIDVITAVLSHHYYSPAERIVAEKNCFRMLRPGGIFVTVENTAPRTEKGLAIGLEIWKEKQLLAGKTPKDSDDHMKRYGTEFFPIGIQQHIEQLSDIGFSTVEIFRLSYIQAGFYAIK
ncbi:MAG: class I SAM-dependent methyltransferase [Candidatus Methanogranum gryphiswaldense]|nr:MAG: class I SAM-dependent methyltransferase [Candidatus Methanogranum sp. U3.2.1]